jgi:hypothetical protein
MFSDDARWRSLPVVFFSPVSLDLVPPALGAEVPSPALVFLRGSPNLTTHTHTHTYTNDTSQATGKDWGNALKQGYREDAGLFCSSDDDEQLIITIPFKQIVNLTSIAFAGPADGREMGGGGVRIMTWGRGI